jgi:hypothetical protein
MGTCFILTAGEVNPDETFQESKNDQARKQNGIGRDSTEAD